MMLKTNPYRMKCLVVDDESIAVKGIANYIGKLALPVRRRRRLPKSSETKRLI